MTSRPKPEKNSWTLMRTFSSAESFSEIDCSKTSIISLVTWTECLRCVGPKPGCKNFRCCRHSTDRESGIRKRAYLATPVSNRRNMSLRTNSSFLFKTRFAKSGWVVTISRLWPKSMTEDYWAVRETVPVPNFHCNQRTVFNRRIHKELVEL